MSAFNNINFVRLIVLQYTLKLTTLKYTTPRDSVHTPKFRVSLMLIQKHDKSLISELRCKYSINLLTTFSSFTCNNIWSSLYITFSFPIYNLQKRLLLQPKKQAA